MRAGLFAAFTLALTGCQSAPAPAAVDYTPKPYVQIAHPDWSRDAVIYQINTRQFTSEGTFAAAQEQLPRLKALGVDILWLMPIHPIGEVNRKGSLGSPYAVKDYMGVNPEFGTLEDFRAFVDAAHAQGFKVIIDWVANHSAWDNPLTTEHPDWYEQDWKDDFHPTPWTDWDDIVDFNFNSPGLRQYMTEAMLYWVRDVGIDGFRCDVAGFVPLDFWEEVRRQLDEVKPVFLLGEWEQRDLHARAFDATYGWAWKEAAHDIAQGKSDASRMTGYMQSHISSWPEDGMRMLYTENHDQNAWEGTPSEFYGDGLEAFMTLQFVMDGIPLIHNGQEAGNERRLAFFEKDPITWQDHPQAEWIRRLTDLKTRNPALWNGNWGGRLIPVETSEPARIVSFARVKDGNEVLGLFNLSPEETRFTLTDGPVAGAWQDAFTEERYTLALGDSIVLPAWGSFVMTQKPLPEGN